MAPWLCISLGWPEMLVVGLLAILLFGRRLPEVGRSLGKGIVEFKKGIKGITDEVKDASDSVKQVDSDLDRQKNAAPPPDPTASVR